EMIMKTINDSLPFDTAQYIAAEVGVDLELKLEKSAEEKLSEAFNEQADDQTAYIKRPPIVTVMGHVDHGKTSLLDRIRSANVTAGEAGGITQHIGAYTVTIKGGEKITFIDTPGHAAFTQMRARGAQITDLAILVIAADDGIMPQTIEAINHAKSAGVPIIIAANKIDKQTANIDRIRQQLTEHEILVEDYGGDVILCPVSAKTGEGIDNLLDSILLMADLKDLKANPDHAAKATIVEAKLDKGKGPVANVIVLNGTLRTGDNVVAGTITGKVRAMTDDKGRIIKEAGPSTPVSIIGLGDVPNAGDTLYSVNGGDKELLKMVAEERKNKERQDLIKDHKMSYEDAINKMAEGELKNLNVIVKADVQGSVEAVKDSLIKLSGDEVRVTVVHSGVGAINETDVTLADSSDSIIIGFNVRPDSKAKVLAERSKVSIKIYRIIYEAIEDVQNAMKGLVVPKFQDVYVGKAEVKQTFKIKGVGVIAGCVVSDGKVVRNGKLMIYRDDVKICEGNVLTLKHYKDEVKEVTAGSECGISIENFNEIKVGDYIECYVEEEVK
ncbi:MAG: translation initiation factor IF-2, partial [Clostridia bacterium]|nr:translation initiation factor IF-2 [Clostridia bacterium]